MIVVYRTIPTSNHNPKVFFTPAVLLYIVLFLHQTTTYSCCDYPLHSCISYYSYIKPQLFFSLEEYPVVVYRTIPTSNHNQSEFDKEMVRVVYRTIPTSNHNFAR